MIKSQSGLTLGLKFGFSFKTLVHSPLLALPSNGPFAALNPLKGEQKRDAVSGVSCPSTLGEPWLLL